MAWQHIEWENTPNRYCDLCFLHIINSKNINWSQLHDYKYTATYYIQMYVICFSFLKYIYFKSSWFWDVCMFLTLTSVVRKGTRIDKFGWLRWLHITAYDVLEYDTFIDFGSLWILVYAFWQKTGQVNELTRYTHTHLGVIFKWRSKYTRLEITFLSIE